MEFPRSLVSVSMGTALLPTLSKYFTKNKLASLLELAAHQRDLLLYVIVPCALGLFFLGSASIEVLFEHGKFDATTSQNTAEVLKIYSVLLVILSLTQVLSSCFFSIKNTWYPALSTFLALLIHVGITPFLMASFSLKGLIWATTISASVQLLLLLGAYPHFIGQFYLKRTTMRFLKTIPVFVLMGVYIKYGFEGSFLVFRSFTSYSFAQGLALFFTIFSSVLVYGYLGIQFRLVQAVECLHLLQSKWKRH